MAIRWSGLCFTLAFGAAAYESTSRYRPPEHHPRTRLCWRPEDGGELVPDRGHMEPGVAYRMVPCVPPGGADPRTEIITG